MRILVYILSSFFCCLSLLANAKDKDSTAVRPSKDLGLYVGGVYSLIQLDPKTYSIGDFTAKPELNNKAGILAGFCYNFYAGKKSIIRPAIEAMFLPATITYQTEINYKRDQRVFPLTVELPLSWIFSSYRTKSFPRVKGKPEFGLSLRPVLSVKPLNDLQPVLRTSNFNTDVFVGYPFANDKSVMRVELFYSHGWFDLVGESNDYRTVSIGRLTRNTAGLRLVFH